MMKKKGGMEEAKSDGSICGLIEERQNFSLYKKFSV
jgi:hypothetical protein